MTTVLALLTATTAAHAWKAGGHYVEAEKVRDLLPYHSIIKKAMQEQPTAWAWGSYGADLGYGDSSYVDIARSYTPWADRLHYFRTGTLARELLQRSLRSGDLEQISFAAGYLTHTTGDLACHGTYANPEAGGVFFDDEGTQGMHGDLEAWADPYVWKDLGRHDIADYVPGGAAGTWLTTYRPRLSASSNAFVAQTLLDVYGTGPTTDGFDDWLEACYFTMDTQPFAGIGGLYCDYDESATELGKTQPNGKTRRQNIRAAMDRSVQAAVELLMQAERGDYSDFVDTWNLDVGERPRTGIGELAIEIHTADVALAGTDDDVFFRVELDDGRYIDKLLDCGRMGEGYNDFEQNDTDLYHLYISDPAFTPPHIKNVWVYKTSDGVAGGWRPDRFRIFLNGFKIVDVDPGHWFENGNLWWGQEVGPQTPTVPAPSYKPPPLQAAGDFDGDGDGDVAQFVGVTPGTTSLWVWKADKGRFSIAKHWQETGWNTRQMKAVAGDVDKDGRDEVCVFYNYDAAPMEPTTRWYTGLLVFDVTQTGASVKLVWVSDMGWNWNSIQPCAGDFNGDGRDELGVFYDYNGWAGIDSGLWTFTVDDDKTAVARRRVWSNPTGWWAWERSTKLACGDVDKDGRDELACLYDYAGDPTIAVGWWVFDVGAQTALPTRVWSTPAGWWDWRLTQAPPFAGDWGGGGRDSLGAFYSYYGVGDVSWSIWSWDVDKTGGTTTGTRPWAAQASTSVLGGGARGVVADLDGDGTDEVVGFCDQTETAIPGQNKASLNVFHLDTPTVTPLQPWADWMPSLEAGTPVTTSGWFDIHGPVATILSPAVARKPGFTLSWKAVDEPNGSGVAGLQIQYRDVATTDPYVVIHDYAEPGTTRVFSQGQPGHTYRFSAIAVDPAGNTGPFAMKDVVVPLDDTAATYTGAWSSVRDSRFFLGKATYAQRKGASASLAFEKALGVGLVVTRRPTGGYASVYIDGVLVKKVDCYAARRQYQVYVPIKSYTTATSGVVKVVVRHAKPRASRGYRVELDGIAVRF